MRTNNFKSETIMISEEDVLEKLASDVMSQIDIVGEKLTVGLKEILNGVIQPFSDGFTELGGLLGAKDDLDKETAPEALTEALNDIIQTPYRIVRQILEPLPIAKGIYKATDTVDDKYYARGEKVCDIKNEFGIKIPNIFGKPETTICLSAEAVVAGAENPDKAIGDATSCLVDIALTDTISKVEDAINPIVKGTDTKIGDIYGLANMVAESLTNIALGLNYLNHPLEIANQYGACLEKRLLE